MVSSKQGRRVLHCHALNEITQRNETDGCNSSEHVNTPAPANIQQDCQFILVICFIHIVKRSLSCHSVECTANKLDYLVASKCLTCFSQTSNFVHV